MSPGIELVGALEHEVFEVVRQAGLVHVLVAAADLVGDHRGDDGRALHRQQVNAQTIIERVSLQVFRAFPWRSQRAPHPLWDWVRPRQVAPRSKHKRPVGTRNAMTCGFPSARLAGRMKC